MVTDPPYGVNYDPNWRNEAAEAGHLAYAASRIGTVDNDDRVDWSEAYELFPGDVAYTWSPGGDPVILTGLALQKVGFQIRNQIIWCKPHFPISRGAYTYQHEPCWYGVKKGRKAHWIGDGTASTRWDIALDKNVEGGHSTQKPLECMARPIRNHEGDVYDPFLGSGTTLIAADQLNRKCYGIEISPAYVAVVLQRATDAGMTCKMATKSKAGKSCNRKKPKPNGSARGASKSAGRKRSSPKK
jgi:DNA modification methylase